MNKNEKKNPRSIIMVTVYAPRANLKYHLHQHSASAQ